MFCTSNEKNVHNHLKCSQTVNFFCTCNEKNVHNHLKCSQLSMFCTLNEKMFTII